MVLSELHKKLREVGEIHCKPDQHKKKTRMTEDIFNMTKEQKLQDSTEKYKQIDRNIRKMVRRFQKQKNRKTI